MLCWIDGDQYFLTLPTDLALVNLWKAVQAGEVQDVPMDHFTDYETAAFGGEPGDPRFHSVVQGDTARGIPDIRKAEKFSWRPQLTPMKRQTIQFDPWFMSQPNGKIITGGSFRLKLGGKFLPMNIVRNAKQITYNYDVNGKDILIGDTPDEPDCQLRWVVWDGVLICTSVLLKGITFQEMIRLGWADHFFDHTYGRLITAKQNP